MRLIRWWVLSFFFGIVFSRADSGWAFTQEIYIWQREFSPAVYHAIGSMRDEVDGCAILAAEISWNKNQPKMFQSSVRYEDLAALGRPIGLVLRIGPYSGPFGSDDGVAHYLKGVVASLLAKARAGGLKPEELQVDFDCASSKLTGYRLWLEALRAGTKGTRLVFTALPDWLHYDGFAALASAADGYILQVHSLEKPTGPDGQFQLCDPKRAWVWIEQAERIGVPYRVALPTYGYRLAFDPFGKFLALAADGPLPAWPAGTLVRTVRTDPSAMAALVRKLTGQKPRYLAGIIWFRLPVAGDQLNWDMTTLRIVMRGAEPVSQLVVEVIWPSPELAEVNLVNRGERDEIMPKNIAVQWTGAGRLQAGDGLGGYELSTNGEKAGSATLSRKRAGAEGRIAPGRTRKIGWIRFSHEISLHFQIAAPP